MSLNVSIFPHFTILFLSYMILWSKINLQNSNKNIIKLSLPYFSPRKLLIIINNITDLESFFVFYEEIKAKMRTQWENKFKVKSFLKNKLLFISFF